MDKINVSNVQAIGERVLVDVYKAAEETSSGLVMDNSSNTSAAPVLGTVLNAGDKSQFKKGDVIFFRRYSTDELKFITEEGEQVLVVVEDVDILAKVN
jgi:co-chaperonin GroES (HSP10)